MNLGTVVFLCGTVLFSRKVGRPGGGMHYHSEDQGKKEEDRALKERCWTKEGKGERVFTAFPSNEIKKGDKRKEVGP